MRDPHISREIQRCRFAVQRCRTASTESGVKAHCTEYGKTEGRGNTCGTSLYAHIVWINFLYIACSIHSVPTLRKLNWGSESQLKPPNETVEKRQFESSSPSSLLPTFNIRTPHWLFYSSLHIQISRSVFSADSWQLFSKGMEQLENCKEANIPNSLSSSPF